MKFNIKSSILFIGIGLLMLSSCEDEDKIRIPEFQTAASMRIQIDPAFSTLDALDVPAGFVKLDIFTENDDLDRVELSAQYYNFEQDSLYGQVALVKTITAGEFSNEGIIRGYEITSQEIFAALGIALADVGGGDRVDIFNKTYLLDGRVYPNQVLEGTPSESSNTTPNIQASAATTSFTTSFSVFVACPIASAFTGKYFMEQIEGPADPFFGNPWRFAPLEVQVSASSPIARKLSGGNYLGSFDKREINFNLICGQVIVPQQPSGVGCGGSLTWETGPTPGTYEEANDAEFIITLIDDSVNDCGIRDETLVIKMTKVD